MNFFGMRLIIFQLLFLLFSLIVIGSVVRKKKEGGLSIRGAIFWILFWLAADAAVLYPDAITLLANRFGIGRGADFVLYISIALMFFLLFRLHIKVEAIGRDVTTVVRRDAINNTVLPLIEGTEGLPAEAGAKVGGYKADMLQPRQSPTKVGEPGQTRPQ